MAKIGDFDYYLGLQNRGIGDKSRSLATLVYIFAKRPPGMSIRACARSQFCCYFRIYILKRKNKNNYLIHFAIYKLIEKGSEHQ